MADILEGATEHSTFAPLSHGQTLAITRHLQDQIRQLHGWVEELQDGVAQTNVGVQGVRDLVEKNSGGVHHLQEKLGNTNSAIEATRRDLARTTAAVQRLQAGLEQSASEISALWEGQKLTNSGLDRCGQEMARTSLLANSLQATVEKKLVGDLAQLRDELSKTNLHANHLRTDIEAAKADLLDDKENIRSASAVTQGLRDEVLKTNTVVHILETRLAGTAKAAKELRSRFGDLNHVVLRLHEDLSQGMSRSSETLSAIRELQGHMKQVKGDLVVTNSSVSSLQGRLDQASDLLGDVRTGLDKTRDQVTALREGMDVSQRQIKTMRNDLGELGGATANLKASLHETNSMVLPNLTLGLAESDGRAAKAEDSSMGSTSWGTSRNVDTSSSKWSSPPSSRSGFGGGSFRRTAMSTPRASPT